MKHLFPSQLPQDVRDLLDTFTSQITELQNQLQEVIQLMAISEADFILLQNKVSTIETNLTNLTTQVTDLSTTLGSQITNQGTSFDTQLATLQSTLNGQITQVATDLSDLETSVTSQIATLQTDLSTSITTQVADLNTTLTTQITNLDTTLTAQITDLDTTLTTQITDVQTTLTTQITDVQTTVESELDTTEAGLVSQISNETTARTSADTTFDTTLQAVLTRLTDLETKQLNIAYTNLTLGSADVTNNLVLPLTDAYGTAITWSSNDETLISSAGVVTRPSYTDGTKSVILTATLVYGEQTTTKQFIMNVIALPISDQEKLDADKPSLSLVFIDEDSITGGIQVTGNKVMPIAAGTYNTSVEWASNDITHFAANGTVTRPAYGELDVAVTLTATLTQGTATATETFTVLVLAETVMPDQMKVNEDAANLSLASFDEDGVTDGIQITGNKVMPLAGTIHASTIEWASNDAIHFATDGTVTRPLFGEPDATITLTATLTQGIATATTTFTVIVLAEIA